MFSSLSSTREQIVISNYRILVATYNSLFLRKIKLLQIKILANFPCRRKKKDILYSLWFTFLLFQRKTSFIDLLFWKLFIITVDLNFNFALSKLMPELRLTFSRVSNPRDCNLGNRHESFAHIITNCRCAWNELFSDARQSSMHFCFSICHSPFACPSFFPTCAPDRNKRPRNTLVPELKNYRRQKEKDNM